MSTNPAEKFDELPEENEVEIVDSGELEIDIVDDTPVGVNMDPGGVGVDLTPTNVASSQASEGILRDMGLVVDTVTDEITGKPRAANFFEKYGNILKLGSVGASIAAAALGEDQAADLYDPEKNPYLKSGAGEKPTNCSTFPRP